jgi:hypothetical protein
MGPGFESQRDHKLGKSIRAKTLQMPCKYGFAGFFVFSTLSKNTKLLQILVRHSSVHPHFSIMYARIFLKRLPGKGFRI